MSSMPKVDRRAAIVADQALWTQFPELKGRQLTLAPSDARYRQFWKQAYGSALVNTSLIGPLKTFIGPAKIGPPIPPATRDPAITEVCIPCILKNAAKNTAKAAWNQSTVGIAYRLAKPVVDPLAMKAGERLQGERVLKVIQDNEQKIQAAASEYGVDPSLVKAIIYEEQTHSSPLEKSLERAGLGNTVGLGQTTVGYYKYSRKDLLSPDKSIIAITKHLAWLQTQPLIDPSHPDASLATKYNCGTCNSITDYGRRVARFRADLFTK